MAMRDGLELTYYLGFHQIEAQSYSHELINFYTGQNMWWAAAATIFAACPEKNISYWEGQI